MREVIELITVEKEIRDTKATTTEYTDLVLAIWFEARFFWGGEKVLKTC